MEQKLVTVRFTKISDNQAAEFAAENPESGKPLDQRVPVKVDVSDLLITAEFLRAMLTDPSRTKEAEFAVELCNDAILKAVRRNLAAQPLDREVDPTLLERGACNFFALATAPVASRRAAEVLPEVTDQGWKDFGDAFVAIRVSGVSPESRTEATQNKMKNIAAALVRKGATFKNQLDKLLLLEKNLERFVELCGETDEGREILENVQDAVTVIDAKLTRLIKAARAAEAADLSIEG